ncbi:uncharacterized protein MONBRDRAFT_32303 [Monosiga brevicollis MX1]|uniref:Sulfotransferase domain-containing protein n=1 Tax=Monosiga brevicollis TaxID=81824 RepID=A9UYN9_MONBE|nr:uncharacterized protein MONBRDRAFT_32303 [Monosiga brevicollis MX1]EDQ89636.1 predicted protein [Monosiga brevicollis MX1]|eukprot:XP_001745665.1 hypothetical protein [Monosiga brevicollis MX1]
MSRINSATIMNNTVAITAAEQIMTFASLTSTDRDGQPRTASTVALAVLPKDCSGLLFTPMLTPHVLIFYLGPLFLPRLTLRIDPTERFLLSLGRAGNCVVWAIGVGALQKEDKPLSSVTPLWGIEHETFKNVLVACHIRPTNAQLPPLGCQDFACVYLRSIHAFEPILTTHPKCLHFHRMCISSNQRIIRHKDQPGYLGWGIVNQQGGVAFLYVNAATSLRRVDLSAPNAVETAVSVLLENPQTNIEAGGEIADIYTATGTPRDEPIVKASVQQQREDQCLVVAALTPKTMMVATFSIMQGMPCIAHAKPKVNPELLESAISVTSNRMLLAMRPLDGMIKCMAIELQSFTLSSKVFECADVTADSQIEVLAPSVFAIRTAMHKLLVVTCRRESADVFDIERSRVDLPAEVAEVAEWCDFAINQQHTHVMIRTTSDKPMHFLHLETDKPQDALARAVSTSVPHEVNNFDASHLTAVMNEFPPTTMEKYLGRLRQVVSQRRVNCKDLTDWRDNLALLCRIMRTVVELKDALCVAVNCFTYRIDLEVAAVPHDSLADAIRALNTDSLDLRDDDAKQLTYIAMRLLLSAELVLILAGQLSDAVASDEDAKAERINVCRWLLPLTGSFPRTIRLALTVAIAVLLQGAAAQESMALTADADAAAEAHLLPAQKKETEIKAEGFVSFLDDSSTIPASVNHEGSLLARFRSAPAYLLAREAYDLIGHMQELESHAEFVYGVRPKDARRLLAIGQTQLPGLLKIAGFDGEFLLDVSKNIVLTHLPKKGAYRSCARPMALNAPCFIKGEHNWLDVVCHYRLGPAQPQCCCYLGQELNDAGHLSLPELDEQAQDRQLKPFCLPTYLIIGAQKAGTTALAALLSLHPMINPMRVKEGHFFDRAWGNQQRANRYFKSFIQTEPAMTFKTLIGDSTPSYALSHRYAQRIRGALPHARLIMLLRNPVARAYSEYQMKLRRIEADLPFDNLTVWSEYVELLAGCLSRKSSLPSFPQFQTVFARRSTRWKDFDACLSPRLAKLGEAEFEAEELQAYRAPHESNTEIVAAMRASLLNLTLTCVRWAKLHTEVVLPLPRAFAEEISKVDASMYYDALACGRQPARCQQLQRRCGPSYNVSETCLRDPALAHFFSFNTTVHWPKGSHSDIQRDFIFRGLYEPQIRWYREEFPADQLLLLTDRQLREEQGASLQAIAHHLGLTAPSDWLATDSAAVNDRVSTLWERFVNTGWQLQSSYQPLDAELRQKLEAFFLPHNLRLFRYLDEELHW